MKDPKEMTREELAEWYDEERDNGNPMDEEIMRRLRNSIDRPKVEIRHIAIGVSDVSINGVHLNADSVLPEEWSILRFALGMEGGEG